MAPRFVSATFLAALLLVGSAKRAGAAGADSRPAAARTAAPVPDTTTTVGVPTVNGRLDPEKIDRVVQQRLTQIRYCYMRRLPDDPTLAGQMTVRFVIARDGTVSSATTEASTMNDPAVESCLHERFLRMRFPRPRRGGEVIVSYPLTFTPGSPP